MPTRRSTPSRSGGATSKMASRTSGISRGGGGKIDNVTYDVITVLHEKSKGLEAYDKYLEDVRGHDQVREVLEEIREQDEQAVRRLEECLRELMTGEGAAEEEAA